MRAEISQYKKETVNSWCPGCGNFAILNGVPQALVDLGLSPDRVIVISDIGQAGKMPHYMRVNMFNGLHGRAIPLAVAAKLSADDMTVMVHLGDGGAYGEGGNHLLHAIRRNIDITVVVHDNYRYGLTKGQASPTTPYNTVTSLDFDGVKSGPVNPLALAVSQSCTFVAQASSADKDSIIEMIRAGINHKGTALINIKQPCVTFDKVHTFKYYSDNCYRLREDYDPTDREAAYRLVHSTDAKVPLGIIYREDRPTLDEALLAGKNRPVRDTPLDPKAAEKLFYKFR